MPTHPSPTTKNERREAARAHALALRTAHERRDRRTRTIALAVLAVGLAGLLAAVAFVLTNHDAAAPAAGTQTPFVAASPQPLSEVATPVPADDTGGFPVGADGTLGTGNDGAVRVDLYLDYMCPGCGFLETQRTAEIDAARAAGEITVVYHPVAILDRLSQGTGFSSRAASAAAYVADRAPASFLAFNAALFENQPEEGSPGLTDAEMQRIAVDAGVPGDVAAGIADGTATATFGAWVTAQTAASTADPALLAPDGKFYTPTVALDGERWAGDWSAQGALVDAATGTP